jgi:hypothetical protein
MKSNTYVPEVLNLSYLFANQRDDCTKADMYADAWRRHSANPDGYV